MRRAGVSSGRELAARTGSPEQSMYRQGQITEIDQLWQANRGFRGQLGIPLNDVQFDGATASRDYAGGTISFLNDWPQCGDTHRVARVWYLGFHCPKDSDWDQGTPSDEPYFIVTVMSSAGSRTVKFGPYENVDAGTEVHDFAQIANFEDLLTPPIILGVHAMENDQGSPEEAANKVRDAVKEAERVLDQAMGAFMAAEPGDHHVMPEWMRTIVIGWAPEAAAAVLGLGDDVVGKDAVVVIDNKRDIQEMRAPAIKGKHGQNDYNVSLDIDGGKEGRYWLFFKVGLFDVPGPCPVQDLPA
jgi:hypothetical protein